MSDDSEGETATYCRMADTGSFTLPANALATITDASSYLMYVTRIATTVVRQGKSGFAVINHS